MTSHRLRAYSLLLIVALIWGIAGPVIKIVLGKVPWDIFLTYRFLTSILIALPFLSFSKLSTLKKAPILALFYAFLNSTVVLALLFTGADKTSLVSMSLISLFGPIVTIAAGYLFLKERITWLEKVGISITFIGSLLTIIEPVIKFNGVQGEIVGNILVLGSLLAGTVAAVMVKELLRKGVDPATLVTLSFAVGFITMIPIMFGKRPLSESITLLTTIPVFYHLGVWYMGVFSGTVAYTLYNLAQKTIEVSEQAVFGYLSPIISTVLAVVILKESITPLSYFAGGVTMVGIFIAEVKRRSYNKSS